MTLIIFILMTVNTILVQSQDPRVSITNTVPDRLSLENLINQNVILVEVVQGKPLTMDCEVENRPEETSVRWQYSFFKKNSKVPDIEPVSSGLHSLDNIKYSVETPGSNTIRLRIKSIAHYDSGNYTCFVMTTKTSRVEQTVMVRVLTPPTFIQERISSNQKVEEGDSVEFLCDAQGFPQPTITWMRKTQSITKTQQGSKLTIAKVDIEDVGNYRCLAENRVGKISRDMELEVIYKPRLTVFTPKYQASGYQSELQCFIMANPEPSRQSVTWKKLGSNVAIDEDYVKGTNGRMELKYLRQANSEVISELIIKRVESQDYGTYVCKATNKMGNTEQLIELLASDTPQPSVKLGAIIGAASSVSTSMSALVTMAIISCLLNHS